MDEKILVVDDDASVLSFLEKTVTENGYKCETASDGQTAINMVTSGNFSLMLLDVNMPVKDGFQVITELRQRGVKIPIIVISGRKEESDTLHGYDIGADDYVTKPFNPVILSGKIKALLRRSKTTLEPPDVISAGPFTFDNASMRFCKNGEEIVLTGKEIGIIRLFMGNPGKIFPKSMIYDAVWGNSLMDENAIMVYMNRIRQKIEDDASNPKYICNVRGVGYRFNV